MQRETALVLLPQQKEAPPRLTPFGSFMHALQASQPPACRVFTAAGESEWRGLPVESAMAHGLWAVMLKIAEKTEESIASQAQLLDDFAHRANLQADLGILLLYTEPEKAAEELRRRLEQAAGDGKSSSPSALADAFQQTSAKFFAELVRATQEYRTRLERYVSAIKKNVGDPPLSSFDILSFEHVIEIQSLAERLNLGEKPRGLAVESLVQLEPRLKSLLAKLRILKKIPIRIETIPAEAANLDAIHIENWMRTQLLLAAGNLPDREYLDVEEYLSALRAIKEQLAEVTALKFVQRMIARGAQLTVLEAAALWRYAESIVTDMKEFRETLDHDTILHVFLARYWQALASAENALEAAKDPGTEVRRETADQMAKSIAWHALPLTTFQEICQNARLTVGATVSGICKMRPDLRSSAVNILLESAVFMDADTDEQSAVALRLAKRGWMTKDAALFLDFMPHSSPRDLPRWITELMLFMRNRWDNIDEEIFLLFVESVSNLPSGRAGEILGQPAVRDSLISVAFNQFLSALELNARGAGHRPIQRFIQAVGPDLWRRAVLACEINFRSDVFANYANPKQDEELRSMVVPVWTDLASARPPRTMCLLPRALLAKSDEAVRILRELSERKILKWMYEGYRGADRKIREYEANRLAYFAAKSRRK